MNENLSQHLRNLAVHRPELKLKDIMELINNNGETVDIDEIINLLSRQHPFSQYYTPSNIASIMAELGRTKNPESIVDICCGIGNILYQYGNCSVIEGYDINEKVIELAKLINPHIPFYCEDSLKYSFNRKYDVVFGAFPFGLIRRDTDENILRMESELIRKAMRILNDYGVLVCLVPIGFTFTKMFQNIRKEIINKYKLKLIVNLPPNVLQYTSIVPTLLVIEKSTGSNEVCIITTPNDLNHIVEKYRDHAGDMYVDQKAMVEDWNLRRFSAEYEQLMNLNKMENVRFLHEVADVYRGYSPKHGEKKLKGKYRFITGRNIQNKRLISTKQDKYIDFIENNTFRRAIARPGDIIINLVIDPSRIYFVKKTDHPFVVSHNCGIIRSAENDYIISYLKSGQGEKIFTKQAKLATKGSTLAYLSIKELKKLRIPILPLGDLDMISDNTIEGSSIEDLKMLKSEIIMLRNELNDQKMINAQQKEFFDNRMQKIEEQQEMRELKKLISGGESKKLEFKSSLRLNIRKKEHDKKMGFEVLKSIAAFLNTEGGMLLIGINDSGDILGIDHDGFSNNDKFLLHLSNLISERMKPINPRYYTMEIIEIDEKRICQVLCEENDVPIWTNIGTIKNPEWTFFIRTGPSSKKLHIPDAMAYISTNFDKVI